jgi:hypothetical protein
MATITLNYDARNTSIKKAFELLFTLGVKIEKEYDSDFVSKIKKAELEKSKKINLKNYGIFV